VRSAISATAGLLINNICYIVIYVSFMTLRVMAVNVYGKSLLWTFIASVFVTCRKSQYWCQKSTAWVRKKEL